MESQQSESGQQQESSFRAYDDVEAEEQRPPSKLDLFFDKKKRRSSMRESATPTKNIFQAFSAELEPARNAAKAAQNKSSEKAEDFFSPLLQKEMRRMSVKVERTPPSESLLYKDINIEEEDLPELEQSFTNYQIQLIHNQRSVIDEDPFEEMTDA